MRHLQVVAYSIDWASALPENEKDGYIEVVYIVAAYNGLECLTFLSLSQSKPVVGLVNSCIRKI
jgi:hypothetical protein